MLLTHISNHKGNKHSDENTIFRFTLYSIIIYLIASTLNPAVASPQPSGGNGVYLCGVIDCQPDNRRYARAFAADLNIGEPRTVGMIYFLPSDRPFRANVVQRMKDKIRNIQTFYAEQMQTHGYGNKTFHVETDPQGEPMVHCVNGQHPDSHYIPGSYSGTEANEIAQVFDLSANVYLIVSDNSSNSIGDAGGVGTRKEKNGGYALVPGEFR